MFKKTLHVLAGLIIAFATMMVFEFINSFFFPFPEGMDITNMQTLQEFTNAHTPEIYIMVLKGWIVGSFLGALVTTKLSKEKTYRLSLIVGIVLTLLGILNNMMVSHDLWFNIVGLPMFLIFTYLGHKVGVRTQHYRKIVGL